MQRKVYVRSPTGSDSLHAVRTEVVKIQIHHSDIQSPGEAMTELKKLLKARERLVVQRETAIAGAKYYESLQLTAQVGIRDIDQAIERIRAEAEQTAKLEKMVGATTTRKTSTKQKASGKGELPATGEGFWLSFLDHDGRRVSDVFNDAIATLKKENKFTATPEQRKKLKNRLAVAFHGAAKNKTILIVGKGRDRLYRLPKRTALEPRVTK